MSTSKLLWEYNVLTMRHQGLQRDGFEAWSIQEEQRDGSHTDIAVFRPSTGVWYVSPGGGGTVTVFGGAGDRPLPLPVAIRQVFFP